MIKYLFAGFLAVTVFASCYYDVEEDLYNTQCDTENVGFASDISPLIITHCIVCHSDAANLGGISLETYAKVKVYIDNGKFIGSVKHEAGFSAMPQGQAKLSNCNIAKIEQWIADGALDN